MAEGADDMAHGRWGCIAFCIGCSLFMSLFMHVLCVVFMRGGVVWGLNSKLLRSWEF